MDEIIAREIAFVAEDDNGIAGFALARRKRGTWGELTDLYVRPGARGRGLGTEMTNAAAGALRELGATHVVLSVLARNREARAFYERRGFSEEGLRLVAELSALEHRELAGQSPSFGSVHVQSDDVNAVVRAVQQFVPRLPELESAVSSPAPQRMGLVSAD